ncbi:rhodanese-like domain-containing protein [Cohnella luojiensis]|uniref:Sulfurtransferase n=1 Tax=Cohnella luojiensis TaxID=652876 RepID=A0A4Y8LTZ9_9BACL|nr:rhodanese-like domain-containing protein [Cohnella luojiensis]TFE23087.1 sulfurtransferase [Cohnella luojiensis]
MAKTFGQLVSEAKENIPLVTPEEAQKMIEDNPNTLIVDVRDAWNIRETGIIAGAIPISVGMLAVRADQVLPESYRDQRLQDRTRPIITACNVGAIASFGAKTLKDMGFTDVYILDGGTKAWKDEGLPIKEFDEK